MTLADRIRKLAERDQIDMPIMACMYSSEQLDELNKMLEYIEIIHSDYDRLRAIALQAAELAESGIRLMNRPDNCFAQNEFNHIVWDTESLITKLESEIGE